MPAGNTYTPIAATTISNSSTSQVTFSSFSGYTDLVLVYNGRVNTQGSGIIMKFNSDSGANYSLTRLYGGQPSTYGANTDLNLSNIYLNTSADTNNAISIINILNYSNTNTYKSVLHRWSDPQTSSGYTAFSCATWRNTNAITQIDIIATGAGNYFVTNAYGTTTFTLYGIAAA